MTDTTANDANRGSNKHSIKQLAAPEDYRIWVVRAQIELERMRAWDDKTQLPIKSKEASSVLISILADNMLDQVLRQRLLFGIILDRKSVV